MMQEPKFMLQTPCCTCQSLLLLRACCRVLGADLNENLTAEGEGPAGAFEDLQGPARTCPSAAPGDTGGVNQL